MLSELGTTAVKTFVAFCSRTLLLMWKKKRRFLCRTVSLKPGHTFLSQTKSAAPPSWLVPGLPETLQLCGSDQSARAAEAAQCPVPRQNPRQQQRLQVSEYRDLLTQRERENS